MVELTPCPFCGRPTPPHLLDGAHGHAFWRRPDGACPACVQQALLHTLLSQGDAALHERIQAVWPLDAAAAFGALPTPLRLHADPRFSGRGITVAVLDSGFYPHLDLTQPRNRIRAWVDATTEPVTVRRYGPQETPRWPSAAGDAAGQWHGMMTAVVAAGNGYLSHGLYRGLASEADLVLIQVRDEQGIHNPTIVRALRWVAAQQEAFAIRVVNMSFGGDPVAQLQGNPVDTAVAELVSRNVVVTVAAGNEGARRLVPPATAPEALTIGGLDDHNNFDHASVALWHSSYGLVAASVMKPELVAPSIWVAAPLLPGTAEAQEAAALFRRRGEAAAEARIAERRLITPHYQHVDGTSVAAALVAGTVACLLQANPHLTPGQVRQILIETAEPVRGVLHERQGAGALAAGAAVAHALAEGSPRSDICPDLPHGREGTILFTLHDDSAQQVQVLGSWDSWQAPGLPMEQIVPGFWQAAQPLPVTGRYEYKFLLDGRRWIADPANPTKAWDGFNDFNSVVAVAQATTPLLDLA